VAESLGALLIIFYDDDDGDDYVDGVRLCLWTVATNGPVVHPPHDIRVRARRTMVEWSRQRKTDSSTRAVWQSYQWSHLVAGRRNEQRQWWIWPCEVFLFILASDFLHVIISYDLRPPPVLPPLMEGMLQIYIALKNPSYRLSLNVWTLGPVSSGALFFKSSRRLNYTW
jgi:hypothetical protein